MLVSEARRTTALPRRWRRFLIGEKCSIWSIGRAPTTMSALPSRIGWMSLGMSAALYWLSASVLTITSAPSLSAASRPAWKAAARPLLLVSRTMWSTPCARATSTVRSVEPSSITSHSTASKPARVRGSAASVSGSVRSSSRQGIWMTSFIEAGQTVPRGGRGRLPSVPGDHAPAHGSRPPRPRAGARRGRPGPDEPEPAGRGGGRQGRGGAGGGLPRRAGRPARRAGRAVGLRRGGHPRRHDVRDPGAVLPPRAYAALHGRHPRGRHHARGHRLRRPDGEGRGARAGDPP